MAKKKIKEHGTEYVLLNDNKNELWEIDYDRGHATNVSEYLKLDSLNNDIITRYIGSIEDFLAKETAKIFTSMNQRVFLLVLICNLVVLKPMTDRPISYSRIIMNIQRN